MVSTSYAAPAALPTARPLDRVAGAVAWLAVAAVLAVALLPLAFHGRTLVVLSGSMAPALRVGDLVVVEQIPATAARRGDVVTFDDPAQPGRLLTHRVRRVVPGAAVVRFVTRGDAARGSERWDVAAGASVERVRHRLPRVGVPFAHVRSPLGRILLFVSLALPAIAWAAWRRRVLAR